ncbi:hypothetical protein P3X46_010907 [Hevea brasiliensis]|uniref:Uncharacterized protein n=1 Tax=Hevea brasiliensis TaxID=3981 RepID=A0ABQ9MI88_HEVBR|nr:hypothetical protein P3X46_010907 [Hevea brasiliensis]
MFGFFCRKLGLNHRSITSLDSKTQLGVLPFNALFLITCFSSNLPLKSNDDSFTISYLINSCGLSPEAANSVSKKLHLKSPQKPDSFLSFLRDHGFSDPQISKVVRFNPHLLSCNVKKTVLPKLEFLHSIGVSNDDLPKMICSNPGFLVRSLEKYLIPCYNILKSSLLSDGIAKNFSFNLLVLRGLGMPQSTISLLVTKWPKVLCQNVDNFSRNKTITKKMDFLVNKMGWQPAVIARYPAVFTYSLENRIVPRCYVIKVLLLKGLIKETISLLSILSPSDESFLEEFVIKHKELEPELLNVLEGKIEFAD